MLWEVVVCRSHLVLGHPAVSTQRGIMHPGCSVNIEEEEEKV